MAINTNIMDPYLSRGERRSKIKRDSRTSYRDPINAGIINFSEERINSIKEIFEMFPKLYEKEKIAVLMFLELKF